MNSIAKLDDSGNVATPLENHTRLVGKSPMVCSLILAMNLHGWWISWLAIFVDTGARLYPLKTRCYSSRKQNCGFGWNKQLEVLPKIMVYGHVCPPVYRLT